jgi:type I restriction enzyme M protein
MSNLSGFVKRLRDIMRNDAGINGDAQRIEQIAWMLFLKVYDAKEQDWGFDDEDYESIIPEPCRWQNWAVDDKSGSALTGDQLLDFVNNTLFPVLKGKDIKDSEGNVIIEGIKVTAETPIKKAIVQTTFADANQYMKDGVLLRQVINVIDELDLSDYEESHAFGDIYESILKELQSAGSAGEFYTPRAVTDFMAQMIQPKIGETMADFACGTGGFITSWLKVLQKQIRSTADAEKYGESIYGIEKKQFPYMLCITNLLLHGLDVPRVFHDNTLLKDVLDYTADDQFDVILMNPPYGGSEKAEVKNHFPSDLASSETADLFMSVIMYRLKEDGRVAVILPDGFLFGTDNAKVNIKKKLLSEFNLHTVIRMPGSVFAPYTSITTNILFFDRTGATKETWFYRLDMPEGYKHFSKTKPMKLEHFAPVVEWWNNRQEITVDGFDKAKKFTVQQLTEELGYNLDQCGYPHIEEVILDPMDLINRYQEERASLNAEIDRVLAEITSILGGAQE